MPLHRPGQGPKRQPRAEAQHLPPAAEREGAAADRHPSQRALPGHDVRAGRPQQVPDELQGALHCLLTFNNSYSSQATLRALQPLLLLLSRSLLSLLWALFDVG